MNVEGSRWREILWHLATTSQYKTTEDVNIYKVVKRFQVGHARITSLMLISSLISMIPIFIITHTQRPATTTWLSIGLKSAYMHVRSHILPRKSGFSSRKYRSYFNIARFLDKHIEKDETSEMGLILTILVIRIYASSFLWSQTYS